MLFVKSFYRKESLIRLVPNEKTLGIVAQGLKLKFNNLNHDLNSFGIKSKLKYFFFFKQENR
jgi:hypothetical protein